MRIRGWASILSISFSILTSRAPICCSLSQHAEEQLQHLACRGVSVNLCDSFTQALDIQASRLAICRLTQLIYFDEEPKHGEGGQAEEAKSSESLWETILCLRLN